ncbi:MAG: potassium/proton antiporter [Cytophagaceae bacterium]
MDLNILYLALSLLIVISIFVIRLSNNFGVPILLLFLGVGMLAGSEGPGGIYFDDSKLAQNIGITALIIILFSGGMDTKWSHVKSVVAPALSLATVGVIITAGFVGVFTYYFLKIPLSVSLLLGAIVASTDAAAVFSIIGARKIRVKGKMTPLLELESGSNDPMAVFLTVSMIELIQNPDPSYMSLGIGFVLEMVVGLVVGLLIGKFILFSLNRLQIPIEGLYPVFIFASAFLVYSLTVLCHGSGFLAVYVAGLVVGNENFVHKKNIFRFLDGMAWIAQVIMFLTLGLLVFPHEIIPAFRAELFISLFLIFIARPISVFIALIPFKFKLNEKLFVSWVGLRGAVPIILATFPLIAGIPEAKLIFNVVFFIVLTSALLQGWTIPWIVEKLKLKDESIDFINTPNEFNHLEETGRTRINFIIPDMPEFKNKPIVNIPELKGSLIVTIRRGQNYFVPSGGTVLETGDELQVLIDNKQLESLKQIVEVYH